MRKRYERENRRSKAVKVRFAFKREKRESRTTTKKEALKSAAQGADAASERQTDTLAPVESDSEDDEYPRAVRSVRKRGASRS